MQYFITIATIVILLITSKTTIYFAALVSKLLPALPAIKHATRIVYHSVLAAELPDFSSAGWIFFHNNIFFASLNSFLSALVSLSLLHRNAQIRASNFV